jgi:SPP1 gp7 family putative phage head morphogenesis protein
MMQAFRAGAAVIDVDAVARALTLNNQHAHEAILAAPLAAIDASLLESLPAALTAVRDESGRHAMNALLARLRTKRLRLAADVHVKVRPGGFNVTNPAAVSWIERHAGELIKDISKTTRQTISELVDRAFTEQFTVDDLAKEIADVVKDPVRAELIARTETMRASNAGEQEAWDQAVEEGLLMGNEKQEWIVTPDDRLCPLCEAMDGQMAGFGETFNFDGDEIDGPPGHPRCRCTVGLQL